MDVDIEALILKAKGCAEEILTAPEHNSLEYAALAGTLRRLYDQRARAEEFWRAFSENRYPPPKSKRPTHTTAAEYWLRVERVCETLARAQNWPPTDDVCWNHCESVILAWSKLQQSRKYEGSFEPHLRLV